MAWAKGANIATIAGFVLYAVITLIDRWTGIKEWFAMGKWGETMLFNLSIIFLAIGIVAGVISIIAKWKGTAFSEKYKFTEVRNKKFNRETVRVDGHSYEHCDFRDVTFEWDATAPFKFQHSSFFGRPNIRSKSPSVSATIILLKALQVLKDDVPLVQLETGEPFDIGVKVVS